MYNLVQIQSSAVASEPWQFVRICVNPAIWPSLFGIRKRAEFEMHRRATPTWHRECGGLRNGVGPE